MNKNYKKPLIIADTNLSEGIYLASGTTCYTTNAYINQTPTDGRNNYVVKIDAKHAGDHTRESQTLYISFNQPVTYVSGAGTLLSGNGTSSLAISLGYHQNPTDNIGGADLTVESEAGLSIVGAQITD